MSVAFLTLAVDALVASQTLRDLGNDRVTFHHDVLREWAIANLLIANPAVIEKLPLDRPAPAALARGTELAARMTIEHAADSTRWKSLIDVLSKEGNHGSWRRSALLALVRSEIGQELLTRASGYLLDNGAKGLRELIRLVMAVDADTGAKWFSALGFDPKLIPANLNVPSGPSWSRLIIWLLTLGDSLPAAAIPDVVDLYTAWSMGMLGQDALTRLLVPWLYRWLMEIEVLSVREDHRRPFNGELTRDQIGALAGDLRTGFLSFCNRAPQLAQEYLQSLRTREHGERALREILKFRGALAQAAPKELAEITAELLIPKGEEDDENRRSPFRDAFGHHDMDFVPASPSQGPFLELLIHAPEHGLTLIRQLIDHAILFDTEGKDFGENAITISFLDRSEVTFPWVQSYNWSRDVGSGPSIAACALMAVEAWGHSRVDAGEPVEKVLADAIGTGNPPAAYLLVAVDLLLSHWPKSRGAAIPFLACPELLCLDRHRTLNDGVEIPDLFGLKALQKEPVGAASLASLKARPSRRWMLDQLLGLYALHESVENRDELAELLRRAAARLGPPEDQSDVRDPEFMAVHALNLIDPKNWRTGVVQAQDGATEACEYVSPETESRHLQPLQEAARERQADDAMWMRIGVALNRPERSSAKFAAAAIEWARKQPTVVNKGIADDDDFDHKGSMRKETLVTAAMIAARDGGAELIAIHETWIRETFVQALKGKHDSVHRVRAGLQFNPIAIAFAGIVLLLKNRFAIEDVSTLLESAGDDNPAASRGFAVSAELLAEIDERLPRAVLRCAFAARTVPHRDWRMPEAEYNARVGLCRQKVRDAIDAELAWFTNKQGEPEWPQFPPNRARPRRRVVLGPKNRKQKPVEEAPEPEMYADHQAAALWLGGAASLFDVTKRPWLRDIVKAYSGWTFVANGSELDENEDTDRGPTEWNDAFFKLLAYCLHGLASAQVEEVALAPITGLPDGAFFDVTTAFLRDVDGLYFNDFTLQDAQAVLVRTALLKRITTTRAWKRHVQERATSTEIHFGPAVAVVLFNDYWGGIQPPKCYLNPKGIDHLDPFLPLLKEFAESAQFLLAVIVLLNLLEVAPRASHLPVIIAAGKGWLVAHPDNKEFWIDQGIGRRLCSLMEAILTSDPKPFASDQPLRKDIDSLLGTLVRMGIAEAHRLEESLRPI